MLRGRQLNDLNNDLDRAVFLAVYYSPVQRRRRLMAMLAIAVRHLLGGLWYLWPVAVVVTVIALLPVAWEHAVYLAALLPGLLLWLAIQGSGVRRDYTQLVRNRLLPKGFIRNLFRDPVTR